MLPLGSDDAAHSIRRGRRDGAKLIEKVELLCGDSALNNGDSVAAEDALILRYTLKPLEESMNLPGSEWDIAIPEYIENSHPNLNQEIKIDGRR